MVPPAQGVAAPPPSVQSNGTGAAPSQIDDDGAADSKDQATARGRSRNAQGLLVGIVLACVLPVAAVAAFGALLWVHHQKRRNEDAGKARALELPVTSSIPKNLSQHDSHREDNGNDVVRGKPCCLH